tara:strand:+ start:867 stop:1121 length:255 start_codon:yes stop_codon:yes gene_type:complete
MPKGKGYSGIRRYTPGELQTLRDHGKFSPSQISKLEAGDRLSPSETDYINKTIGGLGDKTPTMRAPKAGTRRSRSQGYKYFPDN